jgi:hypothetical protein
LTIDSPHGAVAVRALGQERSRVTAPDHEQEIVGFEAARSTAHELSERERSRAGREGFAEIIDDTFQPKGGE